MVLAPLLFCGLLEAGLRIGGYGYPTGFFVKAGKAGNWIPNPRFGWRFFPRPLARSPHPCVLQSKPANTVRIFVLGGSAAMGTPDPAFSFGRILEVLLREQYPDRSFEVINAAMTAINSHAVREIAHDCAAREPDLFVVYSGNNEVVGPYGPGTVFQHWTPSAWFIRTSLWLESLRLGQLIGDAADRLHGKANAINHWRGMEMFLRHTVPADDPRLSAVYENFGRNLTDICGIARRAGAGVVLSTVAVNVGSCPPFASRHRSGLLPAELAKWEQLYRTGNGLETSNHWDAALGQYTAAASIDDRFAELQFRMGACLSRAGRAAEAREKFDLARDLDVLRFRADSRLNAVLRRVAENQRGGNVRFVDAERALAEPDADSEALPSDGLFYEHVHLTFDGNYALARAMLDQVRAALPSLVSAPSGEIPSRQRCAQLLALSCWDDYRMAADMVELTARAPFTNQFDHPIRHAALARRRDALLEAAESAHGKEASWKMYEAAVAHWPGDWSLHQHFARLATRLGRPEAAAEHLRVAARQFPWNGALFNSLGNILADQGKPDEALVQYQKALQLNPNDEMPYYNLANLMVSRRQIETAIAYYRKALQIKPDYQQAHYNLGNLLAGRGQFPDAILHYEAALEIRPDDAETRSNLGVVLARCGRFPEAVAQLERALALKPDDVSISRNLEAARKDARRP